MAGFKKAVRENVWLKIAISGTSGSGKTMSALRVTKGLAEMCESDIAFISTEKSRSLYYADKFDYDILELENYSPEDYINAINEAVKSGYKIIIIDSLSHGWQWLNDTHSKMPGNSFQNWGRLKPRWQKLMKAILGCPAHMFVLSRAKTEWAMEEKNGKSTPTKVGLGVEGDKQQDFEYTVSFMLQQGSHIAAVDSGGKDNTGLYDGKYDILTEMDGIRLYNWANSGVEPSKLSVDTMKSDSPDSPDSTDELTNLQKEVNDLGKELSKNPAVKENLSAIAKKYGNPNGLKDIEKVKEYLEELKKLA